MFLVAFAAIRGADLHPGVCRRSVVPVYIVFLDVGSLQLRAGVRCATSCGCTRRWRVPRCASLNGPGSRWSAGGAARDGDLFEADPSSARWRPSCSISGGGAASCAASSSAVCRRHDRTALFSAMLSTRRVQLSGWGPGHLLREVPLRRFAAGRLGPAGARRPPMTANDGARARSEPGEFVNRFASKREYFLFGRHFGFVPYFFPGRGRGPRLGVLAERRVSWRWRICSASSARRRDGLLFFARTRGAAAADRRQPYFLSVYPAFFFLMPPIGSRLRRSSRGWAALFTAKMPRHPFAAAKFTWQITERGFARPAAGRVDDGPGSAGDARHQRPGRIPSATTRSCCCIFSTTTRIRPNRRACGSRATGGPRSIRALLSEGRPDRRSAVRFA